VVELPFAADCCPCVDKLRTVLPLTVGIRDGAVQLVSTLGSAVIRRWGGTYGSLCPAGRVCELSVGGNNQRECVKAMGKNCLHVIYSGAY
jgi:hypothetical protein